jgi:hypothetical protein
MKPYDAFILFLQDSISNIWMWETIYNPFASNLGIDNNCNWLDNPWIFIVHAPVFHWVESCLCNPKSSMITYTYCIHIVIQQNRTAESEVLHMILPNRPPTLVQNPKTTEYHENRVSFWLVYRIQRFIFIHYQQQTQFKPMLLQLLPLTMVPTLCSVQVLQESSTHWQFCATWSPLICLNKRYNEQPSVKWYAGAIMINPFLSFPCRVLRVSYW